MESNYASRDSWKTIDPEDGLLEIIYADEFSTSEFETIRAGVVPEAMEDKWFIFYERPHLFFHRSWTGDLVYRITLEDDGGQARVTCAELSRKYSDNPIHEKLLPWVIGRVLLNRNIEFPEL